MLEGRGELSLKYNRFCLSKKITDFSNGNTSILLYVHQSIEHLFVCLSIKHSSITINNCFYPKLLLILYFEVSTCQTYQFKQPYLCRLFYHKKLLLNKTKRESLTEIHWRSKIFLNMLNISVMVIPVINFLVLRSVDTVSCELKCSTEA